MGAASRAGERHGVGSDGSLSRRAVVVSARRSDCRACAAGEPYCAGAALFTTANCIMIAQIPIENHPEQGQSAEARLKSLEKRSKFRAIMIQSAVVASWLTTTRQLLAHLEPSQKSTSINSNDGRTN